MKRLFWHCLLLSLPAIALMALGVFLVCLALPFFASEEDSRTMKNAMAVADTLRVDPSSADFIWEYQKGVTKNAAAYGDRFGPEMTWKEWDRRGRVKGREVWGWCVADDTSLIVWIRDGKRVLGKSTAIFVSRLKLLLLMFGPLLVAVLLAAGAISVWNIISYAKSRNDFIAATIHDFGTPLAALRMAIGRDDETAAKLVFRMTQLVDNMRDLRRGVNKRRLECEPLVLRDAFDAAYKLFAADYRALRGKDIEIEGDVSLAAYANAPAAERIIWNLLGNEMKYAAPFSDIRVRIFDNAGAAVVEISDNGPGMTRREMKNAFRRYWRSPKARGSRAGGSGIGLAVSRETAAAMGASLSLSSNSPSGCIFTLSFMPRKATCNIRKSK